MSETVLNTRLTIKKIPPTSSPVLECFECCTTIESKFDTVMCIHIETFPHKVKGHYHHPEKITAAEDLKEYEHETSDGKIVRANFFCHLECLQLPGALSDVVGLQRHLTDWDLLSANEKQKASDKLLMTQNEAKLRRRKSPSAPQATTLDDELKARLILKQVTRTEVLELPEDSFSDKDVELLRKDLAHKVVSLVKTTGHHRDEPTLIEVTIKIRSRSLGLGLFSRYATVGTYKRDESKSVCKFKDFDHKGLVDLLDLPEVIKTEYDSKIFVHPDAVVSGKSDVRKTKCHAQFQTADFRVTNSELFFSGKSSVID